MKLDKYCNHTKDRGIRKPDCELDVDVEEILNRVRIFLSEVTDWKIPNGY